MISTLPGTQLTFDAIAPKATRLHYSPSTIVRQLGLETWRDQWRRAGPKGNYYRRIYREWAWKQLTHGADRFVLLDPFKMVIFTFQKI